MASFPEKNNIEPVASPLLLTQDGYNRLQEELEHLTTVKRAEIAQRLRDSMDHGEFSEDNNELDEVKFEQGMVESRISDLKLLFASAGIIDPDVLSTDEVGIGNRVYVRDPDRGIEFDVWLVSSVEADPDRDFISVESPMGRAIFGAKVGDVVRFETLDGQFKYEVQKIEK